MSRLVRRLSTSSRGSYNLTHGSSHLENWDHQQCHHRAGFFFIKTVSHSFKEFSRNMFKANLPDSI